MIEYEKKFLLRKMNFGDLVASKFGFSQVAVLQGYVPNSDAEVRYRRTLIPNKIANKESEGMSVKYTRTEKEETGEGISRREKVEEITHGEFIKGFERCEVFVDKIRYTIQMDGYEIIVDSFHDSMATLTICEVEILSKRKDEEIKKKLENIQLPDFINKEIIIDITELPEFRNKNLAVPIDSINKEELYL